jgi:hypothetical protein
MVLKHIDIDGQAVESADQVVGFSAEDLPAPGAGFERFFKSLNSELPKTISRDKFDAEVLETYSRKA